MSVVQADVVDAIGVEVSTGKVVLTISDHLGWEADANHIVVLQGKLNSYLRFVESGELLRTFPDAVGREVAVDVVGSQEPNSAGRAFLQNARETMGKVGIELRFRVFREES